jgi:hypothetical protein
MEAVRDGHPIGTFYRLGGGELSRRGGRQMVADEVDSINASVTRIRRGTVEGEGLGEEWGRAALDFMTRRREQGDGWWQHLENQGLRQLPFPARGRR